jgi:hypothetical protein
MYLTRKQERSMYHIEFTAPIRENDPAEVIDRMQTDMTDLPHVVAHAKSLFSNAVHQRTHKPLPHGFRILDDHGTEVAHWSIDETGESSDPGLAAGH